jgi:hypothetical protein
MRTNDVKLKHCDPNASASKEGRLTMSLVNAVIASCATILGFATSAVVAEVRHSEHAIPHIYVSSATSPASQKAKLFTRYRSLAVDPIGVASAAPDFERQAVHVAGLSECVRGFVR